MTDPSQVGVQSSADFFGPQTAPVVTGARVVRPMDREAPASQLDRAIRAIREAGHPLNEAEIAVRLKITAAAARAIVHQLVTSEARLLRQVGEWGNYRYCPVDMLPRKTAAAAPATTAKPAAPQGGKERLRTGANPHPPRAQSSEGDAAARAKQEAPAAAVAEATNTGEGAATGEGGQSASSSAEADARAKGKCPKCGGRMTRFSIQCRRCYVKKPAVESQAPASSSAVGQPSAGMPGFAEPLPARAAPKLPAAVRDRTETAPTSVAVPRQLARENCLRIGREIVSHLRANCTDLDEDHVLRLLIEQHEFSARMLEALPG